MPTANPLKQAAVDSSAIGLSGPPGPMPREAKPASKQKVSSDACISNHGTPLFHYLFPTVQGSPPAEPHGGPARLGPRASLQPHLWVVWPAPAPEAVSAHCPSDRTHTFMHSPCENDHQPPRQPLMEAGDWRSCLCLNSSHGRVPRVKTVIFLLKKHLGNGRGPGSSILITSCGSQAWSLQNGAARMILCSCSRVCT